MMAATIEHNPRMARISLAKAVEKLQGYARGRRTRRKLIYDTQLKFVSICQEIKADTETLGLPERYIQVPRQEPKPKLSHLLGLTSLPEYQQKLCHVDPGDLVTAPCDGESTTPLNGVDALIIKGSAIPPHKTQLLVQKAGVKNDSSSGLDTPAQFSFSHSPTPQASPTQSQMEMSSCCNENDMGRPINDLLEELSWAKDALAQRIKYLEKKHNKVVAVDEGNESIQKNENMGQKCSFFLDQTDGSLSRISNIDIMRDFS